MGDENGALSTGALLSAPGHDENFTRLQSLYVAELLLQRANFFVQLLAGLHTARTQGLKQGLVNPSAAAREGFADEAKGPPPASRRLSSHIRLVFGDASWRRRRL